ncbi:hypothetical protein NW755_014518 [Fusarium falciforme]|uniref:Uncharacterized protein n=1 Tax=Fusarium falciforme TaxID=195108 RepID=A0A9W8QTU1_9HYPO|nr:hypothetical protein NW755_014518 [Fusarium falciforme]KAJ4225651.1 hypothetical protein NW757_014296 [Fusarium falciforme]
MGGLETAVEELKGKYPRVEILPLQVDVRNTSQVQEAFEKIVKKFGRLDIAVNNAGIEGPHVDTHTVDEKDWANLVEINLNGVWRCQREELRIMLNQEDQGLRQGRGRIVNVASTWGICAPPRELPHTAYTAAKHGVVGLTKADAVAYGRNKIRLNAVCPGFVRSPREFKIEN